MNFKVLSFLALLSNGALAVFAQESWKSQILATLTSLPATDESICCDASNVSRALTLLCYFLARTDISLLLQTCLRNVNVETISTANNRAVPKPWAVDVPGWPAPQLPEWPILLLSW